MLFRERAVARTSPAKCIYEAKCLVEFGIFLGSSRNRTVKRCERLASRSALGIWPYRRWFGPEAYDLVKRRRSVRRGHASGKRTALGNERALQTLNEKIEESDAIRPPVAVDEASYRGALHGTVDL